MFDRIRDKKVWANIADSNDFLAFREEIAKRYDEYHAKPLCKTMSYEEVVTASGETYWLRFDQLYSSATMAMIYPAEPKYLDETVELLWQMCNDYALAAMGHYSEYYYGVTPKDYDPYVIDIFGASLAFAMAEIKFMLEDRLPQIVKDRVHAELKRRILDPYLTRKYFWEKHNNNWATVCGGAVGGVILYEFPEEFDKIKDRLDGTMQCYLNEYGMDGVCVEGCAYWGFGFGYFVVYAQMVREFTNGKTDYFKDPKVKSISEFIQKTFLERDVMVTFSDCNTREGYWVGLPHMLKEIYGDSIERLPTEKGTVTVYQHLAFWIRSLVYYRPEYNLQKTEKMNPATYLLSDANWFVSRKENYGFALKGGNNGESHNHCDLGSFILSTKGREVLVDLGSGQYLDGYHTDRRLSFFAPSSASHNVPYFKIQDKNQTYERKEKEFGEQFEFDGVAQDGVRRENVQICYKPQNQTVSCEFSNAYGETFLSKMQRTFTLAEKTITMHDEIKAPNGILPVERFVTKIKPQIKNRQIVLEDVTLIPSVDSEPKITVVDFLHHSDSGKDEIYCIDFALSGNETDFSLTIQIQ